MFQRIGIAGCFKLAKTIDLIVRPNNALKRARTTDVRQGGLTESFDASPSGPTLSGAEWVEGLNASRYTATSSTRTD